MTADIWNEVYVPYAQSNPSWGTGYAIVRSELDSATLDRIIRAEVRALSPQWVDDPVLGARSMDDLVDRAMAAPRFSATLFAAFSANALLLTVIGVFGLVAYSVTQRRTELGIRAALGAQSLDLLVVTMRSAVILAVIGIIAGLAGASFVTPLIESQLYGMAPHQPATFIASAAAMLLVATVAAYLPSRRAARVDPLVALRFE
jgi:putative ABC transport system permease protein